MNYNINGILVPSSLVERNSLQKIKDYIYDLGDLPFRIKNELKEFGTDFYSRVKDLTERHRSLNLEKKLN